MKVNAMAAREKGSQLSPWTYDTPTLSAHQCLIKVKNCGLCHSDVHMIDNDWQMTTFPLVPGHEAVGEVVETGRDVAHLKPGMRVGVGWQRSACLQCKDCLSGNENLCAQLTGVITHGHGGFADYLLMDSRFCFPLPEGIESRVAGPLLCGGITVYSALRHAGMTSGQEIGIIGVGGLGHMAVQFASRLGNRVTVFTTSDDKAEFAARLGASEAIVTRGGRPPENIKRPLDILVSTVPASLDWGAYMNLLGTDGTLSFVGLPDQPISVGIDKLLFQRRRIMASPIGGRAIIMDMLDAADRFGVAPIVETFPLSECNTAIEKVRTNTIRYRAVLEV